MSFSAFCAVLLAFVVAAACSHAPNAPASQPGAATPLPVTVAPVKAASIEIPAIDASSTLVVTGSTPDGGVAVPPVEQPKQAGYWGGAPAPGEPGPALVVGHVNGPDAAGTPGGTPGVFAKLTQLKVGDEVLVRLANGTELHFDVYKRLEVHKTAFPWADVLDKVSTPELRLVTCTGPLNRKIHSFEDNLVVFAREAD